MDSFHDWFSMILRWWHLVAGITWIGASFYFNWLDSLFHTPDEKPLRENNRGIMNETHGGNFYYHEQYFPERLRAGTHAHAWPSRMTFITGLLLLVVIYWFGASTYMIDPRVADITPLMAVGISAASIILCWLLYDNLVKRVKDNRIIFAVMCAVGVASSWGFQQVYGGRAAWISVGVMFGSIMGLNLWLVIAKNSIAMQKQLRAGDGYNHDYGYIAKRRSQHNNYFTLPVLATMVSNHFALAYNHQLAWVILSLLMFAGWGIRHSLNIWYKKHQRMPNLYAAIGLAVLAAFAITAYKPKQVGGTAVTMEVSDAQLLSITHKHCAACHAATPTHPGFAAAAQGLELDSLEQILAKATLIRQRVLVARDMPLANLTGMTDEEREMMRIALDRLGK